MEAHEKCTFCFHNAKALYMESNRMNTFVDKKRYGKYLKKDGNYSSDELIMIGYVGRIPTASFMFRTEHAKKLPDWYFKSICEDLPLKLIMPNFGYAHYIWAYSCMVHCKHLACSSKTCSYLICNQEHII